jgi:hypothetical protein
MARIYTEIDDTLFDQFKATVAMKHKKLKEVVAILVKSYVNKNKPKPKDQADK